MITTLPKITEHHANISQNKISIIFQNKEINYTTLNEKSNQIAHSLINSGIHPHENAAILLKNIPDYIYSYFGILKTGAVCVPLNTFLKAEELKYILNDCRAKFIITMDCFMDELNKIMPELPHLRSVIILEQSAKYLSLHKIYSTCNISNPEIEIKENDTAVIIYTSGTTGHPKGAMLTHKNILSNVKAIIEVLEIKKKDRVLDILPMFHSFTLTVCILLPLYMGISIIIVESIKPFSNVLKIIVKHKATIIVCIPNLYQILSQTKIPGFLLMFNPIRLCVSGGAPLPPVVLENFEKKFKIPLIEGYGLSEASPVVTIMPEHKPRKSGSIGVSIPGVDVKIVNENREELPKGEIGELIVRGPNVMKGYLNQTEETEKAIKDNWLYTGDLAKMDEENYIYIVDRKKDMILCHGVNVYPREIEDVLYRHPKIAECAVVGIRDKHLKETPKVFIVLKEGLTASIDEFHAFFKDKIADYKIPHHFEFMQTLPKTSTGKILKKALRDQTNKGNTGL
ncbi:MAG: long-chain fatty acid--CoA ligase [bacterium]|nr:long-chain fatty acid--CoA ligase [bacterium]